MDRLIYTSMTSARYLLERQATLAHNLANVSTTGFRADLVAMRAVPVQGDTAATRVDAVETTTGSDFTPGPMESTGRSMDVAVQGDGWLAVQAPDGSEAYTRAGNFQVGADGTLQTLGGLPVLGDGGTITMPANANPLIANDGTISTKNATGPQMTQVGRLKLVNPAPADLVKGVDGLFHTRSGDPADADPTVRITSGMLEGSNVNPIDAMVGMIDAARQYEIQLKLLTGAQQNDEKSASLLNGS